MVISIISHKGGTAKTTTAIHLAEIFSKLGSVLLVDLDASCNLSNFYGVESKKTVIDFLAGNKKSFVKVANNISVVPGNKAISNFDSVHYAAPDIYGVVKTAITGMPFDYIIIDTPHAIGKIIQNTIIASDVVIMPVMPTSWSADGTLDVLDEFDTLAVKGRKKEIEHVRPALLPCAISAWSGHDKALIPSLRMAHGDIDILPSIPFNRGIMRDQSERKVRTKYSLWENLLKKNVYKSYEGVAKWLTK